MDAADKDLLCWAIENSTAAPSPVDPERMAFLNAALDETDARRMSGCVQTFSDVALLLVDRLTAMDNLELLIESLDNAASLEKLALWPKILACLEDRFPEITAFALWIIGTAAQNNPPVQDCLITTHACLPRVMAKLRDEDQAVQKKALYAVSSLLCCNPKGVELFKSLGGEALLESVRPESSARARFVLSTVINADHHQPEEKQ